MTDAFGKLPTTAPKYPTSAPAVGHGLSFRKKDIEQSHICLGTGALSQGHEDRHVAYVLNTILGGSMSSRLFQHIREERGLAYSVFSNLTSYSDAGMLTVYAGCANDKVADVIDLTWPNSGRFARIGLARRVAPRERSSEGLVREPGKHVEPHVHLARQELYFTRHYVDETLASIEKVTADDILRVAKDMVRGDQLSATIVGPETASIDAGRLRL